MYTTPIGRAPNNSVRSRFRLRIGLIIGAVTLLILGGTMRGMAQCPGYEGFNNYIQSFTTPTSCDAVVTYDLTMTGDAPLTVTYTFSGATTATGSGTGSGATFNKGVTYVDVNATNSCGSVDATFTVTVVDNVAPTALCQNRTVYLDANGNASVTAAQLDNGSSDNCGPVSISIASTGTICGTAAENNFLTLTAPPGTTITSIDFASYGTPDGSCGNFTLGWCNSDISMAVVQAMAIGQQSVTIPANNATFGDPCFGTVKRLYIQATYSASNNGSFNCANLGNNNQATLFVTDGDGNVATCASTVTVIDNIPPVLSDVPADATVPCDAVPPPATLTATDNCSTGPITSYQFPSATLRAELSHSYSFSGNANDNQGTANGTPVGAVTFVPGIIGSAAMFDGVNSHIDLGTAASISGTVPFMISAWIKTSSSDPQTIIQQRDGNFIGEYMLNLSSNHNASEFEPGKVYFMVFHDDFQFELWSNTTVTDGQWHHIVAEREGATGRIFIDGVLDATTTGTLQALDPTITTTIGMDVRDGNKPFNGMIDELRIIAGVTCPNTYSLERTWVVKDLSGNIAAAQQVLNVQDLTAPVLTLPDNKSVSNTPGLCGAYVTYTVSASDNCGTPTIAQTDGLASGAFYPIGTTTNKFSAVDDCKNVVSGSFTVTVTDNEAPVVPVLADVTAECSATVSKPTTTDNCAGTVTGTTSDPLQYNGQGTSVIHWTFSDGNGNTSTATQNVIIQDVTPPTITIADVTVNNDAGLCSSSQVNLGTPVTGDNCGVASVTNNNTLTTFPVGATTVTWTVTDVNGLITKHDQTVTVVDNEKPVMLFSCSNNCGDHDNDHHDNDHHDADDNGDQNSNNHQGNSTNNNGHHYGDWDDHQVTWSTTPCPVAVNNDNGKCGAKVCLTAPKTTDNCGVLSVTNDAPAGNFFPSGVTTVTWTATDIHGNVLTATQTVTVLDKEKPKFKWTCVHHDEDDRGDDHDGDHYERNGHDNDDHGNAHCDDSPCSMTVNSEPGLCGAHVTLVAPVATDNCGTPTVTNNAPAIFPVGKTVITWTAVDASGNIATTHQTVHVVDVEAPVLTLSAPKVIWPANHKYVTYKVSDMVISAADNCDGPIKLCNVAITTVTSDEKNNVCNQGGNDIIIAKDCQSVQLRAERADNGNGRVYRITMQVQDAANNTGTATFVATCPLTQTGITVDDGVKYTVQSKCSSLAKETDDGLDTRDAGRAGIVPNPDDNPIHLTIAPNPFRSTADVLFDVPVEDADQMVEVKIFDMAGRDVTMLVHEVRSAGHYTATFLANNLGSGQYVAAVHTATHMQSKMMILVK